MVHGSIYLNVPFEEKEEAKSLGAFWDATRKQWYAPRGSRLARIYKWFPEKIVTAPPPLDEEEDGDDEPLAREFHSELPRNFAINLVRMGFSRESFALLAEHFLEEGMKGDLSSEHVNHIILRETACWFPELQEEQIWHALNEWRSKRRP